jgi:hypothetical protein
MLYIPWKYEVLLPNWCKYHGGGYGTGALVIPISHMKHVAGGSFNFRILCNGKIAIFSR